jgi:hypothetical protein
MPTLAAGFKAEAALPERIRPTTLVKKTKIFIVTQHVSST